MPWLHNGEKSAWTEQEASSCWLAFAVPEITKQAAAEAKASYPAVNRVIFKTNLPDKMCNSGTTARTSG